MATCKTLIEAAYSRSTFNDPDKLATNAELIAVIDRRLKQIYSMAAHLNPTFFGKSGEVTGVASAFARPTDVECMIRVEGVSGIVTSGTEISIVPFEDKAAEMAPRVYEFGGSYISVGLSGDPGATDTIKFYYSKRHPDLSTTSAPDASANTLDTSWPEQFNDLIVLHIAKYLAAKDSRVEEVALLEREEAALMTTFEMFMSHVNYGMKARWGHRARAIDPGINKAK